MKMNFRKLKGFLFQHRISATIILAAVLIAVGATIYLLNQKEVDKQVALTLHPKQVTDTRVEAPLTGVKVDPALAKRRALAVVIENHPDARPQSGYNEADIVFETLAEGGITRTLAIFQSQDSKEIGPVRSARSYFVEWAQGLGAIFAHVGGNADALDLISATGISDLNQFYNGNYFWRSNDRYAPHNVYTTTDKLYAAAKANSYDTTKAPAKLADWKDDAKVADRPASQTVDIDFSYGDFHVTYNYDSKTNTYLRTIAGEKAVDKNTGVQIAPKNVIAFNADITPFINSSAEQGVHIAEVGSGTATLFQDGKQQAIHWSKATGSSQLTFTDASGATVKLNRGQTWIEVAPTGKQISAS